MTVKEIKDVIKGLIAEADACHNDALQSTDQDETDRSVHAKQQANLLQALFEIAYQLAVQNERGERNEAFQLELKGMIETKLKEYRPTGNNDPCFYPSGSPMAFEVVNLVEPTTPIPIVPHPDQTPCDPTDIHQSHREP